MKLRNFYQGALKIAAHHLIMNKWSCLQWLVLSILFFVIPPVNPTTCPPCKSGYILKEPSTCKCEECKADQYFSLRNGRPMCNKCTSPCFRKGNLIEVTPCTKKSDRHCQCKPGHYCPNAVNLTCRRDCEPCTNGFTNTSNLDRACQQYTDCARLGMVVIKEGSPTADRVCGKPASQPILNPMIATPDIPYTTAPSLSPPIHKLHSVQSDNPSGLSTMLQFSSQNPVTSLASETTVPSGVSAEVAATPGGTEGPVLPHETLLKKTTYIILTLLLLTLCLMTYLFLKRKSRAIKNKLAWAGLANGRYQPVFPTASYNSNVETPVPASEAMDTVRDQGQGQGSFPGKNQQVTMEHFGKADGINNTVGSIFIYSPGMVILGSNSNERKEEAETSGEDSSEDTCLMSVPQQESSCEEDFIRLATQEELGKELSIPIPATSK